VKQTSSNRKADAICPVFVRNPAVPMTSVGLTGSVNVVAPTE